MWPKLIEQYPGFDSSEVADESFVQSSFADATAFLKTRVGYVWNRVKDDRILSACDIGTWSRYVQWSQIEKHCTSQDRANLPQATVQNPADKRKQDFTVVEDALPGGRVRLNKVAKGRIRQHQQRDATPADFEVTFGGDEVAM